MIKLQSYFDVIRVSNQMLKIISFRCIRRSIDDLLTEIHPMSNQTEKIQKKIQSKMFYKNSFSFEKRSRLLKAFYNCQ